MMRYSTAHLSVTYEKHMRLHSAGLTGAKQGLVPSSIGYAMPVLHMIGTACWSSSTCRPTTQRTQEDGNARSVLEVCAQSVCPVRASLHFTHLVLVHSCLASLCSIWKSIRARDISSRCSSDLKDRQKDMDTFHSGSSFNMEFHRCLASLCSSSLRTDWLKTGSLAKGAPENQVGWFPGRRRENQVLQAGKQPSLEVNQGPGDLQPLPLRPGRQKEG
jgi:hypothetical protein